MTTRSSGPSTGHRLLKTWGENRRLQLATTGGRRERRPTVVRREVSGACSRRETTRCVRRAQRAAARPPVPFKCCAASRPDTSVRFVCDSPRASRVDAFALLGARPRLVVRAESIGSVGGTAHADRRHRVAGVAVCSSPVRQRTSSSDHVRGTLVSVVPPRSPRCYAIPCVSRRPRLPECTDSLSRRCDTFARVVAHYIRTYRARDAAERRRFERLPSLSAAVRESALSRCIDGKRHSHQRRIPGRSLSKATDSYFALPSVAARRSTSCISALPRRRRGSRGSAR